MNDLFCDIIDEGWLVIYIDDMLVFSKNKETHWKQIQYILQRLCENNLFLKAEKCVFDTNEVEFLSLIIKPGKLHMNPVKPQEIQEWPTPKNVKQVWSFLSFSNFYYKFILYYTEIAWPMQDLTKKEVE